MTNPVQPLDPIPANNPVTPGDGPGAAAQYTQVTPHGQGTAPYNVQAPQQDLSGVFGDANAVTGAGVLYPRGPRQAQAEQLLSSTDGVSVTAGWSGGAGDPGWPNDVLPGS